MSENQKAQAEEANQVNGEQPQAESDAAKAVVESVSVAEVEALKAQLAEVSAKSAEYLDGWQRSQAEFVNYKKRLEREQSLTAEVMRAQNIKKYLPVLDDLERAMANRPADNAWANGIDLVIRKFQSILDAEGVKRIEAEGQPFDPNLHEAISHEPNDGVESGHVIAVVQHGYIMGERVIRHALVRVAQ
jgi:molecular chaperone GrpE